ncbi:MAG: exosortase/archaeosortase family protein [Candidatus Omnitrophica bacterium]|nr:exosortase/archaeosortase family protein [Candidatus Omnitrophota bacterium]
MVLTRPVIRQALFGLLLTGAFALLFWPTLVWMAARFTEHSSFYSHGWIVPFASGWLVWQRRASLNGLAGQGDGWGLALLIPAAAIHVLASWWQVGFVSGIAMVVAVWGLVWTCWGRATLQALKGPLLFLLFMVPLPSILLITTSFKMKLLAASLASVALKLMGIHALQAGSTIQVPGMAVVVDETCSGLRSLISLIALATLWTAGLPPSATWRHKLTIIAAAIPIAIIANVARIMLLALLAAVYGSRIADSFIHWGSGIVVFGVSLSLLIWLTARVAKPA